MADPPLDVGAVHDTVATVLLAFTDAVLIVGVPGTVEVVVVVLVLVVIELLLDEYEPVPTAFTAATVNV